MHIAVVAASGLLLATFSDDATKGRLMSGDWGSVLTELIPLALVVALSPLSIIPAVLVLHTPRPRPTGLAFLAGWLFGLAVLTAIFVEVSDLIGGVGNKPPGWASWLRVVIGAALIVFGVFRWLTRKRSAHSPRWMQSMSKITPLRAAGMAAVLTVANPKVLFICAAAGLAIGTAGLGNTGRMDCRALVRPCGRLDRGDPDTRLRGIGRPPRLTARRGSRTGWNASTPHWSPAS